MEGGGKARVTIGVRTEEEEEGSSLAFVSVCLMAKNRD